MTPQFSIFVAFLMERGCLFALPNIRGGSEFGVEWHKPRKDATARRLTMIFFLQPNGSLKQDEPLLENSRSLAAQIPACWWALRLRNGQTYSALLSVWFRCWTCCDITFSTMRTFGKMNSVPRMTRTISPPSQNTLLSSGTAGHGLSRHDDRLRRCRPELQSAPRPQDDRPSPGSERFRTSHLSRLQQVSRAFAGTSVEPTD